MKLALLLLVLQGCLGALDTLWYHEWKQQLPSRRAARLELRLHAIRDFAYTILFGSLAWFVWGGALAWLLAVLLFFEICVTLWDFVEEDRHRPLPPGERVMHTLMAILYGAFLAYLIPEMLLWTKQPTGWHLVSYGWLSMIMSAMAIGVTLSGIRDLVASFSIKTASVQSREGVELPSRKL
tara:strand:+ start:4197 stop:4739 length:543 start_codon:yes stop_codon:yes gene_type:complete